MRLNPVYDFCARSYVGVSLADGAPRRRDGVMAASSEPGLGVTPCMDVLGDPVLSV